MKPDLIEIATGLGVLSSFSGQVWILNGFSSEIIQRWKVVRGDKEERVVDALGADYATYRAKIWKFEI